jgi:hypothetical protein
MSNYNWMTKDQQHCYQMLCDWLGGAHHVPQVKPCGLGIKVCVFANGLSTFDFHLLTKLVFFAHDRCVRVELANGGPWRIGVKLHRRHTREGCVGERHPTMEEALQKHRQNWQTVDWLCMSIPADPK